VADQSFRPEHELRVERAQLPEPRGGRGRAFVAGAVVLSVIVAGLWLSALGSSDSRRAAQGQGSPVPSGAPASGQQSISSSASPAPDSSPAVGFVWPPLPPFPVLTPAELEAGVADRSLNGALVFIHARLEARERRCGQSLAVGCVIVGVPGLDLPIELAPELVYWQAPPPGSSLVMRPEAGRLVYLGLLDRGPVASMSGLLARRPTQPFPMTLALVGGWLLTDPHGLCTPAPDGTRCTVARPFLAADQPLRNGTVTSTRGATVGLESGALGLGDGTTRLVGTFLVRHAVHSACQGSVDSGGSPCPDVVTLGWDVVGRLEGARRFQVTVP
jgi:hypothetical protein